MFSRSALRDEIQLLSPPGHFHTIPACHCPATERHYAVKWISQIWCSPFQMPARLQLCCCDRRQFGDFHILQTESRRLDLSAVFAGSPAFRIDAAAAVPRLGPVWADCFNFTFFSFFFNACTEFVLSTLRRSPSVGFAVCRQARLFVFASICQKIASNQIPLFDVRRDSCARWAELMFQHSHNFITVFGKSLMDSNDSNSSDSNIHWTR